MSSSSSTRSTTLSPAWHSAPRTVNWSGSTRAFAELLGYRPDELTKFTVADLTPASYRDSDDTNTRRLLDGTLAQVDVLKKYVHAAGHLVAVHVRATVVRTGTGEPYILAHILPDELDRARRTKPRAAAMPKRPRSRV